MKKFVFSLERMLTFQVQNLDKEKGTLGRMMAEKSHIEDARKELITKLSTVTKEIALRETQGTTAFVLKSCYCVLSSGREHLKEIEQELSNINLKIEKQQQVVIEASKEVKKLEKLKENQWEEYCRSEAKEQQETVAEHIAGEFVRKGNS